MIGSQGRTSSTVEFNRISLNHEGICISLPSQAIALEIKGTLLLAVARDLPHAPSAPRRRSERTELVHAEDSRRYVPRALGRYPLKYRSRSFFHFAIQPASAAVKRASNRIRSFSISSSLAPRWACRMDCRNQRRAVSESLAHSRKPS